MYIYSSPGTFCLLAPDILSTLFTVASICILPIGCAAGILAKHFQKRISQQKCNMWRSLLYGMQYALLLILVMKYIIVPIN